MNNKLNIFQLKKKGNCLNLYKKKNMIIITNKCNKHINGVYYEYIFDKNKNYNIYININKINCNLYFYYGINKIDLVDGINNFIININDTKIEIGIIMIDNTHLSKLILYDFKIELKNNINREINLLTYDEFIENNEIKNKKNISKYIFKTSKWNINDLPSEIINVLNENCNKSKDYKTIYFSDNDMDNFIKKYYPTYFLYYNNLIPGAFRSDFFRLLVIYYFGGVYSDIGHLFICNISNIISENDELILVKDISNVFDIHNSFIAAYPKHPIIKKMIEYIYNNISNLLYCNNYLDITGPYAIGKAFNIFFGYNELNEIKEGIYEINLYKINLLKLHCFNNNFLEQGYLLFENNKVIKTKFNNNYYKIMYNNNNIHYSNLYKMKKVYKNNKL